jgi:hypothetical protein
MALFSRALTEGLSEWPVTPDNGIRLAGLELGLRLGNASPPPRFVCAFMRILIIKDGCKVFNNFT